MYVQAAKLRLFSIVIKVKIVSTYTVQIIWHEVGFYFKYQITAIELNMSKMFYTFYAVCVIPCILMSVCIFLCFCFYFDTIYHFQQQQQRNREPIWLIPSNYVYKIISRCVCNCVCRVIILLASFQNQSSTIDISVENWFDGKYLLCVHF